MISCFQIPTSRCCVKDGDFVLVSQVPKSASIWEGGNALKNDLCGAIQKRTICDVRMSCKCSISNVFQLQVRSSITLLSVEFLWHIRLLQRMSQFSPKSTKNFAPCRILRSK